MKRDYYAEEVDFLHEGGTSDRQILAALGVTAAALARGLYREGRHDIAAPFSRIARADYVRAGYREPKRGTCADCGTSVWRKSIRCIDCSRQRLSA